MEEILFSIFYGGLMILVILFIQFKLKKEYATSEKASNKEGNKQEVIA